MSAAAALLLLASFSFSSATTGIGKCNTSRLQLVNVDFEEFFTTNGGVWPFVQITESPVNSLLSKLTWVTKPTGVKGLFHLTTDFVNKDGKTGTLLNADIQSSGYGFATAKGSDFPYTLKFYFLKAVPDGYFYFYVCADDGEDDIDYRYVVSQKRLTYIDKAFINNLEEQYKFRGVLSSL